MNSSEIPNITTDDCRFFTDSIACLKPYCSEAPRNHDSLFTVTKGTLMYEKGSLTEFVNEGQIGYIAKGSVDKSSAYNCDEVSYIAVNFNYGNNASAEPLPFDTVCCKTDIYGISELFSTAVSEYGFDSVGSHFICDGILRQIIGILYNRGFAKSTDHAKERLEASIKLLKESFCQRELSIKALAEASGVGEKQFRRLFHSVYGQNPGSVIMNMRLKKAEALLLNNSKSISDIALECGFSDIYSFSHCFKKHFGVSPKRFAESRGMILF